MHWLGPYVKEIIDGGAVCLAMLSGESILGYVNGSHMKPNLKVTKGLHKTRMSIQVPLIVKNVPMEGDMLAKIP